ncbi:MAG TPA: TolC family protein [Terriglobia bacterium]|nr:TolC family protein [Terriglobia bacterium]
MILIFLLLLQTAPGTGFDQLAQTALAQNKSLQAAREQLRQAEARLTQAGLRPNPSLDVSQSTDAVFANEGENGFAVTLSQPFELGGKREKRIRVAQAEIELAKAEIDDAERQLLGQLRTAYLRAAEISARMNLLQKTRGVNRQMVQVMTVRLGAGDASPLESHLLQAEANRIEAQRLQAESELTQEVLEIRKLAGLGPDDAISVETLDLPANPAALDTEANLIEMALRNRPDVQAARLREALAGAGVTLAQAQAKPNVVGSVRYAREPNVSRFATPVLPRAFEIENVLDFGVSIPLPFFNREQGNIREAASKMSQATAERQALENSIRAEVVTASRRYQAALRSLELMRTGVVNETEQGFLITQLAYRLGDARLSDVLFQQRSLIDAQVSELTAQAEAAAARAAVELAVGQRSSN